MKVKLLTHTPEPEKVVAAAAKLCYSKSEATALFDGLDEEKCAKFVQLLAEMGHESPIEHASFTFAIEGVSRAALAQITRHRIASYSVQSQRYVKKEGFDYIIPPAIADDSGALAAYKEAMSAAERAYDEIARILYEKYLAEAGSDDKATASACEKRAIEDARFVLPNACDTQMIVTMDARSLLNFFKLRCCNRAQWEIRAVADEMLKQVKAVAPHLFAKAGPPCAYGPCTEGKMSCGHPRTDI